MKSSGFAGEAAKAACGTRNETARAASTPPRISCFIKAPMRDSEASRLRSGPEARGAPPALSRNAPVTATRRPSHRRSSGISRAHGKQAEPERPTPALFAGGEIQRVEQGPDRRFDRFGPDDV